MDRFRLAFRLRGSGVAYLAAFVITQISSAACADLYQDLGGKTGIAHIVGDLVTEAQLDRRISAHFRHADLDRLREQFIDQICNLSGGPCQYQGKDMISAHKNQIIDIAAFNALVEDLQAVMTKSGIANSTQNALLAKLAPMYRQIVNH